MTTTIRHVADNLTWLIRLHKYFNKIVRLLTFTEYLNSFNTVLVLEGGMRVYRLETYKNMIMHSGRGQTLRDTLWLLVIRW